MTGSIKERGAFYTPDELAAFMCKKSIKRGTKTILEPSYGDGLFIKHIQKISTKLEIDAVEIDYKTFINSKNFIKNTELINENFLCFNARKKYDLIIGNPPFVRTRNLKDDQKEIAQKLYKDKLNLKSHADPSLWLLFIYKSLKLLKENGSICFVLPYDMTFVSYATPLWEELFSSFGEINVYHSKKRYFPDLLQDTIVLKLDGYGKNCSELDYLIFDKSFNKSPTRQKKISKHSIQKKQKPFKYSLLPNEYKEIEKKIDKKLIKLGDVVKFHIGYVSGNKNYFHPNKESIKTFGLTEASFLKTIANPKIIKDIGLFSSDIEQKKLNKLFYPTSLSEQEQNYIKFGEENNFHKRRKTSSRNPWYLTPLINKPDLLLITQKDHPMLINNNARYIATNTFLCGYICEGDLFSNQINIDNLVGAWNSSITKLFFELEVHSIGGGRLIMIPGEICNIRIPKSLNVSKNFINHINKILIEKDLPKAIQETDNLVLKDYLKLNKKEIHTIQESIEIMKYWRKPT